MKGGREIVLTGDLGVWSGWNSFVSRGASPGSSRASCWWYSLTSTLFLNFTLLGGLRAAVSSLVMDRSWIFWSFLSIWHSSLILSGGRFWRALVAGSCGSLLMGVLGGGASPFGIAVIEDRNGEPFMMTYLPLETLVSSSLFTISKDSVE